MAKSFMDAVSRAIYGPPERRDPVARPRSSYEAAGTDSGNERHWQNADRLSGRQANSPEVRRTLVSRSRLETDNGGNCRGTIETVAHDMVGTGARLQLIPPPDVSEAAVKFIESEFANWADDQRVDFADVQRVAVESEQRDGESFGLLATNDEVEHAVKLAVRLVETEQVATPDRFDESVRAVDGIEYDKFGNPTRYAVLKAHPGEGYNWDPGEYQWWPAESVLHWFRAGRPSHARAVPRTTPGLSLHAHKRAFTRSVLGAARIAAMLAGVLKTNLPPDDGPIAVEAYDVIPMDHDGLISLPAGWEASQMEAQQPTATHKEFSDTLMTEFGRGLHAPRNIVTGDSSPYNYSSARLDHIIYRGALKVARNRFAIRFLDRVFKAWYAEAILIPGYIPDADTLPPLPLWSWTWQYDGIPSIDPVKDASAAEIDLRTGVTNLVIELAARGIGDWRAHLDQIAAVRQHARAVGIEDLLWPAQTAARAATMAPPTDEASVRAMVRAMVQDEIDTVLEDRGVAHAR